MSVASMTSHRIELVHAISCAKFTRGIHQIQRFGETTLEDDELYES